MRCKTKHGWDVRGIFAHGDRLHGLVFNPYLRDWFHAWWDQQTGRCLMFGADERYDLANSLQILAQTDSSANQP